MNLPGISVLRPIFTTMVTMIVILLGVVSFNRLKIDLLPNIELPTISVRAGYDGASPDVIELQVTSFLEEIIATVPGITEMHSESEEGRASIRVRFAWGTNIDAAALEVMAVIEDEINELPDDIERPRVSKYDINSFPVVILGISSTLNPIELTEIVENQIRYRFSRVPGVAQVDLFGGERREVRIELDRERINSLGLPLDQVLSAVRDANMDLPTGSIQQGRYEVTLRAPARFSGIDQIRDTILEIRDRAAIKLGEIANVLDTSAKRARIVRVNGEPGLRVGIRKQPDANTVEVSKAILEAIDEINREFPQVRIIAVSNQGNFIERSIANVARSVLYGGGLAILTLLFFLRNIRTTIVISTAIPISIAATFALIYFSGFTLNLMTLGGLALGEGMMVDSSIVVIENIYRRFSEEGESAEVAAVEGASEVGPAIVASTLTTLVIFLPLVFVRGISGVLFKEMAFVVVYSLLCSLAVAMTLVPMLASKLLRGSGGQRRMRADWLKRLAENCDNAVGKLDNSYRFTLQKVLRRRVATIVAAVSVLAASFLLTPFIGTEFLPPSDEGAVSVSGRMEIGTRLELLDERLRRMEAIVYGAVPETVSTVASIRGERCSIDISLTPTGDRGRSSEEIADDLRGKIEGRVAGVDLRVRVPSGQFVLDRLIDTDESLEIEVRGYDFQVLRRLAKQVEAVIKEVPGVSDVNLRDDEGVPQVEIHLNRNKISDLGLSVRDVTQVLRTAIAGSQAGNFHTSGNAYRILLQLKDAERLTIEEVLDMTLTTPGGEVVALRNLVETSASRAPGEINRRDQQRFVSVGANVAGRDLGSVASDIQEAIDEIPRPTGYDLVVSGDYEEQQKAFRDLTISLMLALLLVS